MIVGVVNDDSAWFVQEAHIGQLNLRGGAQYSIIHATCTHCDRGGKRIVHNLAI